MANTCMLHKCVFDVCQRVGKGTVKLILNRKNGVFSTKPYYLVETG